MDPGGGFPREVVALIAALGAAVMCCGHCLWRWQPRSGCATPTSKRGGNFSSLLFGHYLFCKQFAMTQYNYVMGKPAQVRILSKSVTPPTTSWLSGPKRDIRILLFF